ncbi:MAG: hypothetical protein C4345_12360 [Chloroflexota bacterium]
MLSDIQRSCSFIIEQASTRTLEDYEQNLLVRSAIERHFEIIGEALIRLTRSAPETVGQISNASQIIGFRHRLDMMILTPRSYGRSSSDSFPFSETKLNTS